MKAIKMPASKMDWALAVLLLALIANALHHLQPIQTLATFLPAGSGYALQAVFTRDPVEKAFLRLLRDEHRALAKVESWLRQAKKSGPNRTELERQIADHWQEVSAAYRRFLEQHPGHAGARLKYGNFLADRGQIRAAAAEWERARELEPDNPESWERLAEYYSHGGGVREAFECYVQLIELEPANPSHYESLATIVFLFRKDAAEHFQLQEQEVFDRALRLYQQALERDSRNYARASELAMTYYGVTPPRPDAAIAAWQRTLALARDGAERDVAHVHLARLMIMNGRFEEAVQHLSRVKSERHLGQKERFLEIIAEKGRSVTVTPALLTVPER